MLIFNYDKSTGKPGLGIPAFFQNIKAQRAEIESINNVFANMNMDKNFMAQLDKLEYVPVALKKQMSIMEEGTLQGLKAGQAYALFTNNVSAATKAMRGLASIVTNVFSGLLTMAAINTVMWGIKQIVKLIQDAQNHSEIVIQKGKEAQEASKKLREEIESMDTQTADLVAKYNELRSGVSMTDNSVKNLTLTNEQYNEFLDVNKKIVELYPSVITGIDGQGNALANLGTNAKDVTEKLKEYRDIIALEKAEEIRENLNATVRSVDLQNEGIQSEISGLETQIEQYREAIEGTFSNISENGIIEIEFDITTPDNISDVTDSVMKTYTDVANKLGLDNNTFKSFEASRDGGLYRVFQLNTNNMSTAQIDEFKEMVSERTLSALNDIDAMQSEVDIKAKELGKNWKEQVVPDLLAVFSVDPAFINMSDVNKFGEDFKANINSLLLGLDYSELLKQFDQSDSEYFSDFVLRSIIYPISNAVKDNKIEVKDINDLFTINYNDLNANELKSSVESTLQNVFGGNNAIKDAILVSLGIKYVNEADGKAYYTIDSLRDRIYGAFVNKATELNIDLSKVISVNEIEQLSLEAMNDILEAMSLGEFNFNTMTTFDGLQVWLEKYKEVVEEASQIVHEDTLADMFADKNITESLDKFKEDITSITGALEKVTKGELTQGDMESLITDFDSLASRTDDFSYALSELEVTKIQEMTKYLQDQRKTLAPDEYERFDSYVRTLLNSFGELGVNAEIVKTALTNLFPADDAEAQVKSYEELDAKIREAIGAEYGTQEGNEILLRMAFMHPDFGEWSPEQIKEWFEKERIMLHFDADETSMADMISAAIEKAEANNALKQAGGRSLTSSDYDDIIAFDRAEEKRLEDEFNKAVEKRNKAQEDLAKNRTKDNQDALHAATAAAEQAEAAYINAQAKTIEDIATQQKAPLAALEEEFKSIQGSIDTTNNQIEALKNNGKIGTEQQYQTLISLTQDQINNLEKQKEFQEGLKEFFASDENFGVDSTHYTDAETAIVDLDEQITSLTGNTIEWEEILKKIFADSSFEYLLGDSGSDTGIRKITEEFTNLISSYDEYQEAIKNGEEIDFTQIEQEIPKLAGSLDSVDSVYSKLNDLKADAMVDFAEEFSKQIKDVDRSSEAFDKAIEFMINALNKIDLSTIDVDTIKEKIKEAFSLKDISPDVADIFFAQLNQELNSRSDYEALYKVTVLPDFKEMTPEKIIGRFRDLKIKVKIEADKKEFEEQVASLEALFEKSEGNQGKIEAQRGYYTDRGDIEKANELYGEQTQELVNQLAMLREQKRLYESSSNPANPYGTTYTGSKSGEGWQKAVAAYETEIANFETKIINLQGELEKLQEEEMLAPVEILNQELEGLTERTDNLSKKISNVDEYTEIPQEDFDALISSLSERVSKTAAKKAFYESVFNRDDISGAFRDTLNGLITESQNDIDDLQKQIQEYWEQSNLDSGQKLVNSLELQLKSLESTQQLKISLGVQADLSIDDLTGINEIKKQLADAYSELAKSATGDQAVDFSNTSDRLLGEIAESEKAMLLHPLNDLEKEYTKAENALANLEGEMTDLTETGKEVPQELLRSIANANNDLLEQIDVIRAGYANLAADARASGRDDWADEWEQKVAELDQKYNTQRTNTRNAENAYQENELTKLQNSLTEINRQGTEIEKLFSDKGHAVKFEDYAKAIGNSNAELINLNQQLDYYERQIDGMDVNSSLYQQYAKDIDGIKSQIDGVINKQKEWGNALLEFPMQKLAEIAQEYADQLDNISAELGLREAKGERKSQADYERENEIYANSRRTYNAQAMGYSALSWIGQNIFKQDADSELIKGYERNASAARQNAITAETNLIKNQYDAMMQPYNDAMEKLGEIESLASGLQTKMDASKYAPTDEDISQMQSYNDQMREQLRIAKETVEDALDVHVDDSYTATLTSNLTSIEDKFISLAASDEKFENILSNRYLTSLQTQYTNIDYMIGEINRNIELGITTQEDGLAGLIAFTNSQIQNMSNQIDDYTFKMAEIRNSDANYLDNSDYQALQEALTSASGKWAELIKQVKEYREQLLSLPTTIIEGNLNRNVAFEQLEQARLDSMSSRGETINPEDYDLMLKFLRDDIAQRQAYLDEMQNQLTDAQNTLNDNNTTENLDKRNQAAIAVINAQADLEKAEAALYDAEATKTKAYLNEHTSRLKELEMLRSELEIRQGINESLGLQRGREDVLGDISMAGQNKIALEAELEALDKNPGENELEYQEQRLAILQQIGQEQQNINRLSIELAELPGTAMERVLKGFQNAGDEIAREIQVLENAGKNVSDELYQKQIDNNNTQINQLKTMQSFYEGLVKTFSPLFSGSSFVEQWKEAAKSYGEQIQQLEDNNIAIDAKIDNKSITDLQNKMSDLKDDAEEFQKVFNDSSKAATESDYVKAIANAEAQQRNLNKQTEYYNNLIEEEKLTINDPKYYEYLGNLREIDSEYDSLTESIKQWTKAMKDLPFDETERRLERNKQYLDNLTQEQSNATSLGYRMTEEDYQDVIRANEAILVDLRASYIEHRKKLVGIIKDGGLNSADYDAEKTEIDGILSEIAQKELDIAKANQSIDLLPVQQLEREKDKIVEAGEEIQAEMNSLSQQGFDIPEELYVSQLYNITEQKDILEEIKQAYLDLEKNAREAKYADLADSFHKSAESIGKDIDTINGKEIEVKASIGSLNLDELDESLKILKDNQALLEAEIESPELYRGNLELAYNDLASNLEAQQRILLQEITEHQNEMQRIANDAEALGLDVNDNDKYLEHDSVIKTLVADYNKLTVSIKNFADQLKKTEIDKINTKIAQNGSFRNYAESMFAVGNEMGITRSPEDFANTIAANQIDFDLSKELVDQYARILDTARAEMVAAIGKSTEETKREEYEQAQADYLDAVTKMNENEGNLIKSRIEQQKASIEPLKNELVDLQNAAETTQGEITKLQDQGLSGTRAQYEELIKNAKGQKNNLEEQKKSWEEYRTFLTELFNELGLDPSTSTLFSSIDAEINNITAQQETLTQSTGEWTDILKESFGVNTFGYLLSNKDSSRGIQQMASELNSLISTYDNLQNTIRNGEGVDLSQAVLDIPKLAGSADSIDDVYSKLNELKADAIVDFAREFSAKVKDINRDSAEFEAAMNFMVLTLKNIDLTGVDTDTFKQKIEEALSVEGIGKEWADKIKEELNGELTDRNDYEAFFRVAMLLGFYDNMTPEEVLAKYKEMKLQVEMEVNTKAFDDKMAEIEARLALIQSGQSLTSAQNSYYSRRGDTEMVDRLFETRNAELENEMNTVKEEFLNYTSMDNKNNPFSDLYEGLKEGSEWDVAVSNYNAKVIDYITQLVTLQDNIEQIAEEEMMAPIDRITEEISNLSGISSGLIEQIGNTDEFTEVGQDVFNALIGTLSEERYKNALKQTLIEGLLSTDGISEEFRARLTELLRQVKKDIGDLDVQISDYWEQSNLEGDEKLANRLESQITALQNTQGLKISLGIQPELTVGDYEDMNYLRQQLADAYGRLADASTDAAEKAGYESNMSRLLGEIGEDEKNAMLVPVHDLERDLTRTQGGITGIENQIKDLEETGQEVPQALYGALINANEQLLRQMEEIRDAYVSLVNEARDSGKEGLAQEFETSVQEYRESIASQTTAVREAAKKPAESQLAILENELARVQNKGQELEKLFNDGGHAVTFVDYTNAIKNTSAEMSILQEQLEYYQGELVGKNENNPLYQEAMQNIETIQNQMADLVDKQEQWKLKILELPIAKLEEASQKYQDIIDAISDETSLLDSRGLRRTQSSYDAEINAYTSMRDAYRSEAVGQSGLAFAAQHIFGYDADSDIVKGYLDAATQARSNAIQADAKRIASEYEQLRVPLVQMEEDYGILEEKLKSAQNTLSSLEITGIDATKQQYQDLIDVGNEELQNIETRKAFMVSLADYLVNSADFGTESSYYKEAVKALSEYDAQIVQLKSDTAEWMLMVNGGIELDRLERGLSELERQAQIFDDMLRTAEANNKNASLHVYGGLADNGRAQIENLRKQNAALKLQQNLFAVATDKWAELQSQIDQNNLSINQMVDNIHNWEVAVRRFASTNATALKNVVDTAIAESMSSTGMTQEVMDDLLGQFSELTNGIEGLNLSAMFYDTANGIKLDVNALELLVDAQYKATRLNITRRLNDQNNQLRWQAQLLEATAHATDEDGRTKRNAAKQNLEGIKAEIRALKREATAYDALNKYIKDKMSGYSKWQAAEETENPGDRYVTILNAMEDMTERRNKGLIGTDEFKEFVAMIDHDGRTSALAFDQLFPKLKKYLTEDSSGMQAFANDLVAAGFGGFDGTNYQFLINDIDDVAHSFGMSVEMIEYFFGRLQDFGFNMNWADTYTEGTQKISENNQELIDEIIRLNDLRWTPNTRLDAVNESQQRINELMTNYYELYTITDRLEQEQSVLFDENTYYSAIDSINGILNAMFTMNLDESEALQFYDRIEEIAHTYGIKINEDWVNGWSVAADNNYFTSLDMMTKLNNKISQYRPDLDFENEMLQMRFRNAYNELQEIIDSTDSTIDINLDVTQASKDELANQIQAIDDLQVQLGLHTEDPLNTALSDLKEKATAALQLEVVLETTNMTFEEFAALTDDKKREVIINATANTSDETAQAIIDFANGKKAMQPIKIEIDDTQFDRLIEALNIGVDVDTTGAKSKLEKFLEDANDNEIDLGMSTEEISTKVNNYVSTIKEEAEKIYSDQFHLGEYADEIMSGTLQTTFGNIDMNMRQTITWTEEKIQQFKEALETWDYTPQVGSIDTVWGGSGRFGEDKLEYGVEVAFTPIMQTDQGAKFLDKNTVSNYIEGLIEDSTIDGTLSEQTMIDLDAAGRYVGETWVQGLVAAIDEGTDYENNSNWAETVGRLMHFSGDYGSIGMADQSLELPITGDLEQLTTAIKLVQLEIAESENIMTIQGDNTLANESVEASVEKANSSTGTITVEANIQPANTTVNGLLNGISNSRASVNIGAKLTDLTNQLTNYFNNSTFGLNVVGNVSFKGNNLVATNSSSGYNAFNNMVPSRQAFAKGTNGELTEDTYALVNEISTEAIIYKM